MWLLIWKGALGPFSDFHWWLACAAYDPFKDEQLDVTQELVADRQRHVGLNVVAWSV